MLDTATGRTRRVLDGDPSTQVDKSITVTSDGRPLKRADGRGPQFGADGIALSRDGTMLYWQALTGDTLYRMATSRLRDPASGKRATGVERHGKTFVSDGYWIDRRDRLFLTSPEDNSVKLRAADGSLRTVVQDQRLRWPDSMAEGADGTLFVTAPHIQDMAQFTGKPRASQTQLFRFKPAA